MICAAPRSLAPSPTCLPNHLIFDIANELLMYIKLTKGRGDYIQTVKVMLVFFIEEKVFILIKENGYR